MSYELGAEEGNGISAESVLGAIPVVGQAVGGLIGAISGLFGGGTRLTRHCVNLCTGETKDQLANCEATKGWMNMRGINELISGQQTPRQNTNFPAALRSCGGCYSPVGGYVEKIAPKYGTAFSGLRRGCISSGGQPTSGGGFSTTPTQPFYSDSGGGLVTGPIVQQGPFAGIDPNTLLLIGGGLVALILATSLFRK